MTKPFNWRDYITIDDKFAGDKALIEKALDDIAATGPDGQQLIKIGYQNSPDHQKINIHFVQYLIKSPPGEIKLDMHEVRISGYKTPLGEKEHASLTGILVHELFHQADFNCREDVKAENYLNARVVSSTLSRAQRKKILKVYEKLEGEATDRGDKELPERKPGADFFTLEDVWPLTLKYTKDFKKKIARATGIPASSFELPSLSDKDFYRKHPQDVLFAHGTNPAERDATNYTDVFMAKYFPSEPWRGSYNNTYNVDIPTPSFGSPLLNSLFAPDLEAIRMALDVNTLLPTRTCGAYKAGVYKPEEISLAHLGHFKQPVIVPSSPCGRALPGKPMGKIPSIVPGH